MCAALRERDRLTLLARDWLAIGAPAGMPLAAGRLSRRWLGGPRVEDLRVVAKRALEAVGVATSRERKSIICASRRCTPRRGRARHPLVQLGSRGSRERLSPVWWSARLHLHCFLGRSRTSRDREDFVLPEDRRQDRQGRPCAPSPLEGCRVFHATSEAVLRVAGVSLDGTVCRRLLGHTHAYASGYHGCRASTALRQ